MTNTHLVSLLYLLQGVDAVDINPQLVNRNHIEEFLSVVLKLLPGVNIPKQCWASNADALGRQEAVIQSHESQDNFLSNESRLTSTAAEEPAHSHFQTKRLSLSS